jgi:UDP-glucose 4-epimerase
LMRALTGFTPRVGFDDGVRDLVDWFSRSPQSRSDMLDRIADRNWLTPEAV